MRNEGFKSSVGNKSQIGSLATDCGLWIGGTMILILCKRSTYDGCFSPAIGDTGSFVIWVLQQSNLVLINYSYDTKPLSKCYLIICIINFLTVVQLLLISVARSWGDHGLLAVGNHQDRADVMIVKRRDQPHIGSFIWNVSFPHFHIHL